ncbi:MAG: formylmethanofuran dehydrogenase subunit C [Candidatus Bathyarchaeia archaeon]
MGILITPKFRFKVPIEASCITPDNFSNLSLNEILSLEVFEGNRKRKIEELFEVKTETYVSPDGFTIRMVGDFSKVKCIGAGMSMGKIAITGVVGMRLGEGMKGGSIEVRGNAGSWVGTMMSGGKIEVFGDTGDYTGASYWGSVKGMSGGEIIIYGNASNETGCYMRDGLIKVYGSVGQFTGVHMRGGTVLVHGDSNGRDGAEMVDGKIVVMGRVQSVLPSFRVERIASRVKVGKESVEGPFYVFTGDLTEEGNGKLYISKVNNQHLEHFDKYLLPVKLNL